MSSAETGEAGTEAGADAGEAGGEAPSEVARQHAAVLEDLKSKLGDAVVGSESRRDDLWVRVRPEAWRRTGEACRSMGFDYFCFLSGIDWMPHTWPNPKAEGEGEGEESETAGNGQADEDAPERSPEADPGFDAKGELDTEEGPERPVRAGGPGPERPVRAGGPGPERPVRAGGPGPERPVRAGESGPERPVRAGDTGDTEAGHGRETGYAGGDTRFQVLARVYSISRKLGVTLKADLDDDHPSVETWSTVYAGADWHERETWEMYGFDFVGHPHLVHLYLPGEFEGFPLRKDFPLLAREVKPWPGLVDPEPMPEEPAAETPAEGADEPAEGADEPDRAVADAAREEP